MLTATRLAAPSLERQAMIVSAMFTLIYASTVILASSPLSFYTLDDPYIHFALAENIARGHFGVNLNEVSNPSSSILWPWLMAGFERLGLMLWAPLIVNIASFLACVRLLLAWTVRTLAPGEGDRANALFFVGLSVFSFNLFGVIFTGMEHSLHTLVCMAAVMRVLEKRYDAWTLAALILAPLVRFEGVLVLCFGLAGAVIDKQHRFAALALGVIAIIFAAYETYLASLGLPALPSSVLAKSSFSSGLVDGARGIPGMGAILALMTNFGGNVHAHTAPLYGAFAAILAYLAASRRGRDRLAALGLIGVLAAAFATKAPEVYGRYDVYVLCTMFVACSWLLRVPLAKALENRAIALSLGGGLVAANAFLGLYVFVTTPLAANNIDRQQHQMHRFAAECWNKPIAVNDLGWVSFRNDSYVFDLFGLGNETARKARANAGASVQWMDDLVRANRIELAVIYHDWFGGVPRSWVHVGDLELTRARITPSEDVVSFYAMNPAAVAPIETCLRWLRTDLPNGAAISLVSERDARQPL